MRTKILFLAIASVLSGCTTESLVRDNVLPECPGSAHRATSRAAACMTAALYEVAMERDETPRDRSGTDKEKDEVPAPDGHGAESVAVGEPPDSSLERSRDR